MCGIVGYVGGRPCKELLLTGLERLEYRGYDSAGICLINGKADITRRVGKVAVLRMCGIVGYVGGRPCKELLLTGLERLEYRGYDSAGICLINGRWTSRAGSARWPCCATRSARRRTPRRPGSPTPAGRPTAA